MRNPGASNVQVFYGHPDPTRTRENRYAHYLWQGPEALNVSSRLDPATVLDSLTDDMIAHLFLRSMSMSGRPTIEGRAV